VSNDNKQLAVERGNQAKSLLENPLLGESAGKLKEKYFEAWRASSPEDIQGRERLFLAYGMVDQIYAHLRVLIGDGQIAAQQLDKLKGKIR
jgi:hypothetical protein